MTGLESILKILTMIGRMLSLGDGRVIPPMVTWILVYYRLELMKQELSITTLFILKQLKRSE